MTQEQLLSMNVEGWGNYFLNPVNTREINLTILQGWWNTLDQDRQLDMYPKMVQAVLNRWSDLLVAARIKSDLTSESILVVAEMSFDGKLQFRDYLRPFYNRLWQESPRPHGDMLREIALYSRGNIPVSRAEIGIMFEIGGWGIVAMQIASKKGYQNDAITLMEELANRKEELSISHLSTLVSEGLSKLSALRWARAVHGDCRQIRKHFIDRWEKELLVEGVSREEVFR